MGELHLEVLVDRMLREFKVEANIGRPQVSYRETIKNRAEKIEGKFVRQTGGSGQYGVVYIDVEPAPGEGFDFINKIKGDRKSTRLNSSHANISYAVFCLKKKKNDTRRMQYYMTSITD